MFRKARLSSGNFCLEAGILIAIFFPILCGAFELIDILQAGATLEEILHDSITQRTEAPFTIDFEGKYSLNSVELKQAIKATCNDVARRIEVSLRRNPDLYVVECAYLGSTFAARSNNEREYASILQGNGSLLSVAGSPLRVLLGSEISHISEPETISDLSANAALAVRVAVVAGDKDRSLWKWLGIDQIISRQEVSSFRKVAE